MKTLINALPLTTLRVYPKIIPYHSRISYLSNRSTIKYYSSDSENKSDEELLIEKLLLQNKMKKMTVKEFRGTWILKIMDLYYVGQKTDRFSSITLSDLNCYIDEINNEEYRLEQLSLIYFKPGVIGSDMHFKGVPVVEVLESNQPPMDLGIPFQYRTVYMEPMDEFLLSALGYVLLNQHFPSYLDDIKSFGRPCNLVDLNMYIEDNFEETLKVIIHYVDSHAAYEYLSVLVYYYMFYPYIYCIDHEAQLFPPLETENTRIQKKGFRKFHKKKGKFWYLNLKLFLYYAIINILFSKKK